MSALINDTTDIRRANAAALNPQPSRRETARLAAMDLVDHHAMEALIAAVNVSGRGAAVTVESVRAEIQRRYIARQDGEIPEWMSRGDQEEWSRQRILAWFDALVERPAVDDATIARWEIEIATDNENRAAAERDGEGASVDEIPHAAESEEYAANPNAAHLPEAGPSEPAAPRKSYHRVPDVVDEIIARAADPWASLTLGGEELVSIRAGGNAAVMGPTGSGKTSLVAALAIEHARARGPVVVMSRELPRDEFVARMIGMQCDAGWADVLRGKVARDEMRRRVEGLHRMFIADRRDATLASLTAMIEAAQLDHPGEIVLVVVDYVQIVEASHATDMRVRVVDVIAQIDDLLRHYRCAGLLISQMSRSSSRAARNGEAVGADSTDGGAESAAIERTASVTLSIGASGPQRDDGTCAVELSIGKSRMFGGDRVIPMSYDGRTGRWRIAGDARSGADVKAERAGERDNGKRNLALLAMVDHATRADKPLTREELYKAAQGTGGSGIKRAALTEALETGALVELAVTANRSTARLIWTPGKATSAGIVLARELVR